MNSYVKVGVVVVVLLILVLGPLLQIYDCFNDPPTHDHDALLHTVDALLSIGLILAFNFAFFLVLTTFSLVSDSIRRLRHCYFIDFCVQPIPSISPQALSLRI